MNYLDVAIYGGMLAFLIFGIFKSRRNRRSTKVRVIETSRGPIVLGVGEPPVIPIRPESDTGGSI